MEFVDPIRLSDISVVNVRFTKTGRLLQFNDTPQTPKIALRAEMPAPGGTINGLVGLSGAWLGTFLGDEELPANVALDVTQLAEIVVSEAGPRQTGHTVKTTPGMVCQCTTIDDQPWISMAVQLLGQPDMIVGYIHLDGPDRGKIEHTSVFPIALGKVDLVETSRS